MTEHQFKLLADIAILGAVIAIALIVLSPSGSTLAGGERGRELSQAQTWVVHGLMFGGLGFVLAVRIAANGAGAGTLARITFALLLLALLGGVVEAAQLRVDSRSASYGDWVGDVVGSAIGLWLGSMLGRPLMLLMTRR